MNPAIDGHGISASDECWDDDQFREMYFGGGYDIPCEECGGLRVIDVIDEDRCTPEQITLWEKWLIDDADYRAEREAEMRAGC